jgi:hypothetical protein
LRATGDGVELTQEARVEATAAQSERFDRSDLRAADGDVELTEKARLEAAAQQSDLLTAEDLRVGEDDEIEVTDPPTAIDRQVARFESLTGVDVPGEGDVLPDVDPAEEIESATGVAVPTAGDIAETTTQGVGTAVALSPVGQIATSETAGDVVSGAQQTVDALDVTGERGQSEAAAEQAVEQAQQTEARQLGQDLRVDVAQALSDESDAAVRERVEARAQQQNIEARQTELVAAPAPAIGRNPASAVGGTRSLARAGAGIGSLVGGGLAVNELEVPSDEAGGELEAGDSVQDVQEIEPVTVDSAELDVGAAQQDISEVSVPDQSQQRDATLQLGQQIVIGGETVQEEQQPEIAEDIERLQREPEQRGPSVRERQRREDLNPFERTFPTGGSAVVGGEGGEGVEEPGEQARQPEATEPAGVATPVTGQSPIPGLRVGPDTGTRGQQQPQTVSPPGLGLGQQAGVGPGQGPAQAPGLATGTPPGFGEPGAVEASRQPSRQARSRLDLPDFPGADDDEDEERALGRRAGEVITVFRDPLSGEPDDGQ